MPRRNSKVRTRKVKRDREKGVPRVKMHEQPRVKLEDIVLPDGRCGRKARFATKDKADAALRQAQHERARRGSTHVEKRYYRCDRCDGYHLTSREAYDANAWKGQS